MEQIYFAPWQFKSYGKNVHIYEYCTILKPEQISIGDGVRVDSHVKCEGGEGLTIGNFVHVASFAHLNSGGGIVVIGPHAGIATGAKILSGCPDLSYLAICPNEPPEDVHPLRYTTTIGEYAFICAGAVVNPGVTVGMGAVCASGSVVTKDVEPFTIVAGVPAKVIGIRDVMIR